MDALPRKTILVPGSTAGIGQATAIQLAAMGARVLLHRQDRPRLEETAARVRQVTGRDNLGLYEADLQASLRVQ